MPVFRKGEMEKFIRRCLPDVARISWDVNRGHTTVYVDMADGRRVGAACPSTATDQPRRRKNIVATLRRKLESV